MFGLSPNWPYVEIGALEIEKNAIKVNTFDYQTNISWHLAIGM